MATEVVVACCSDVFSFSPCLLLREDGLSVVTVVVAVLRTVGVRVGVEGGFALGENLVAFGCVPLPVVGEAAGVLFWSEVGSEGHWSETGVTGAVVALAAFAVGAGIVVGTHLSMGHDFDAERTIRVAEDPVGVLVDDFDDWLHFSSRSSPMQNPIRA